MIPPRKTPSTHILELVFVYITHPPGRRYARAGGCRAGPIMFLFCFQSLFILGVGCYFFYGPFCRGGLCMCNFFSFVSGGGPAGAFGFIAHFVCEL